MAWVAFAGSAGAQWSPFPDINAPIVVAADVQSFPASGGQQTTIVAWRSARFDPGSGTVVYDIDAQRLDSNGVKTWGPNGVHVAVGTVSGVTGPEAPLSLTANTDGSGILAWQDVRNSPDPGDIYTQKLNAAGIPQWPSGGIPVTTAFGLQRTPVVLPDAIGSAGAIFAWQDYRAGPTNADIYAQKLSASGLPQWVSMDVAVTSAPGDQLGLAAVAVNGFSFFAWTDSRGGDPDIYAQQLDVNGGPQWTLDGMPVAFGAGTQARPAIAYSPGGLQGPVIVWEDDRNGDNDVYAQMLGSFTGSPVWTAAGVQVASTPNASAPVVSAPSLFVAWQDERNGATNRDIFAQRLSLTTGAGQWAPNGVALCEAAGNQTSPQAVQVAGSFLVAWEDARNGATDIYAQRIDAPGVPLWTAGGSAISTAPGRQARISIVGTQLAPAGMTLYWEDDRNSATSPDIYGAKVDMGGFLLPVELQSFRVE